MFVSTPYAAALGACLLVYFVVFPVIVYFRDAKGLRRYPNMHPLSGISNIPFMIVAHSHARSSYLAKLHKTHPVIRTGPSSLSYGDVRAIKDIYGHNTPCTKDQTYIAGAGTHYHLADVVNKHDHQRKRKVLSAAYAIKNLEGWEHKVADKTLRMLKHFDTCCTKPLAKGAIPKPEDVNLDYRAWTNFFSLDAIADIGISEKLGFLDQGNDSIQGRRTDGTTYDCNLRECLYGSNIKQSLLLYSYQSYPLLNKLSNVIPYYGRMGKLATKWDGIPTELAHRRLQRYRAGEKLDDFFQALMEDKNGHPNNLEWGEIVAEINIMMNAGSVTTAIAMTNVLYQLLKNPTAMQKVVEEIDAALEDDEEEDESGVISHDKVKHLPYLRACIDESLRLFPPTPQNLGRETPPDGTNILGDYIPGGVSVSMSALVAHRCERTFPQADQYIPERWLGEEGKALQPYFITFSAGARGCIGRNISYLEQTVVLASVLKRYGFALSKPDFELKRCEGMNWLLEDMPVKIWRRESTNNTTV
ncbi:cytochrome P450 monooxygenase [Aaosphaeria arxii CBS 175.79]|uniref:Cytochrome P450 monooxygenase n=1 Tax=Aaosphaeria arxii CBS 175.79 TaxID=1450172 RepID=A0A6A5XPK2_9PLEO|nr:cytochrome P450 monooxygenase [Aaosphaeria arxii CBS 175.79]KAF2014873.1 cytochrome P450 monooxygenase [Aaosphaeria arxii CBS 175.79]